MYFLFDEIGLLIVIIGCFFGGFLPLMILIMICPEAREHIKCRVNGGIIVELFYDTGQCEYVVAKPKGGEGQYIAGKNVFGQRRIFVKPRMQARFMDKPFLLSGMRRLKYFCYAGKTPIVNHETLLAMNVAEAPNASLQLPGEVRRWAKQKFPKMLEAFDEAMNNGGLDSKTKDLSPEIEDWAKNNGLHIEEPEYAEVEEQIYKMENGVAKPSGTQKVTQQVGAKEVYYQLSSLDPRKIKQYFSDHYDESQIDNLLEAARIEGLQEGREGKKFAIGGLAKIGILFIVIAIIGGVIILGLQGGL